MTEKTHPSVGGGQKASEMYDIKRDSAGNAVMNSTQKQLTPPALNSPTSLTVTGDRAFIFSMAYTNIGTTTNLFVTN